jgi:hypothetical protein
MDAARPAEYIGGTAAAVAAVGGYKGRAVLECINDFFVIYTCIYILGACIGKWMGNECVVFVMQAPLAQCHSPRATRLLPTCCWHKGHLNPKTQRHVNPKTQRHLLLAQRLPAHALPDISYLNPKPKNLKPKPTHALPDISYPGQGLGFRVEGLGAARH